MRGFAPSDSLIKLTCILYYTQISSIRSNRFVLAYFFLYLSQGMMYLGFSIIYSIIPNDISFYVLLYISFSDVFLKYYMPGMFVEYIFPLLQLTLVKNTISNFVVLSILFYFQNIAILLSLFFGVSINSVIILVTILTFNHIVVFILKMRNELKERIKSLLPIILLVISCFVLIWFFQTIFSVIIILVTGLVVFHQYLNHSLYVK